MKKEKRYPFLFVTASVFFFVAAAIGFLNDDAMAPCWLCLGTSMLCLSSVGLHKSKKVENNEDKEDKQ